MTTSPCESCGNLDTPQCYFCSHPAYSKFKHRDTSAALVIYSIAALLIAGIIAIVIIIANS